MISKANQPYRDASVGYRAEAARFEAGIAQDHKNVRTSASVEGAVAMIGGGVYTSGRIDDAFAVVDVHAPGVKVERENVVVGKTNADGKILIPSLGAYHNNKISIDPMDLPLNAEPATTYDYVRPGFKSGVYVDFNVKKASPSAIVILKDAGRRIPDCRLGSARRWFGRNVRRRLRRPSLHQGLEGRQYRARHQRQGHLHSPVRIQSRQRRATHDRAGDLPMKLSAHC